MKTILTTAIIASITATSVFANPERPNDGGGLGDQIWDKCNILYNKGWNNFELADMVYYKFSCTPRGWE